MPAIGQPTRARRVFLILSLSAFCLAAAPAAYATLPHCGISPEGKFAAADTVVQVMPLSATYWKEGAQLITQKIVPEPNVEIAWNHPFHRELVSKTRAGKGWILVQREPARRILTAFYQVTDVFKGRLRAGDSFKLRDDCIDTPVPERHQSTPNRNWYCSARAGPSGLRLTGVAIEEDVARPLTGRKRVLHLYDDRQDAKAYRELPGEEGSSRYCAFQRITRETMSEEDRRGYLRLRKRHP